MFATKWASIDDRSPFGQFWFEPVTRHSITGMRVGPDRAMQLSAVYACVKLLAKTFPVMPFRLLRPASGGKKTPVDNHPLVELLGQRPNRWQNPYEFRQMLEGHVALRGNAYCVIEESRGTIQELIPKHPDRMEIEVIGNDFRYAFHERDGSITHYPRGEIWHMRDLSHNGMTGLNPIECHRDTVGLGLAAQEYGARFFANDGTPPGWIEHPGQFPDEDKRAAFRESWQRTQTGSNRGKTAVLERGMKYHEITVKNSDAQYLESRRFSVEEVCRMFGVPPHLVGYLEKATFSNIEQQSLEFVIYTMSPLSAAWAANIKSQLLSDDDQDLEACFDVEALLRGDRASRADFYTKMFANGSYSTNDIRAKEGENPVDGGDVRFRPANLTPLIPDPNAPPAPGFNRTLPAPAEDGDGAEKGNGRAEALAGAAAERLMRKEIRALAECRGAGAVVAFYEKHAQFVADALGIELQAAKAYCVAQMERLAAGQTKTLEQTTRAELTALALGQLRHT